MTDPIDSNPLPAAPSYHGGSSGPGRVIRLARESAGLSIDDLAFQTRLTRQTLEALERDDFATLSEAVYIRGYYRKCAKALVLTESELIAAYERVAVPKAPPPPTKLLLATSDQQNRSRKSLIVWLILVVLAVAVGAGLFLTRRGEFSHSTAVSTSEPATSLDAAAVDPNAAPVGDAATSSVDPQSVKAQDKPAEAKVEAKPEGKQSALAAVAPTETKPAEVKVESKPDLKPDSKPESKPDPKSTEVVSSNAVTPSGPMALNLKFRAQSWVHIEDATGKVLLSRTSEKGADETVMGKPPYSILLGNAPAVSVQLGGQAIPIDSYIRESGTARFQLPPAPVQ